MAAPMEHDAGVKIDLLHPEFLSEEGLRELFRQRFITVRSPESCSKEDLVQLYYKTIIPLPQRHYRNNRRGKLMKRSQMLIDKRNKRPKEEAIDVLKTCLPTSSKTYQPVEATPLLDRLKPPPEKTSLKGVINLKAKPYGIGEGKADNPLDRVVIKTFKKKDKDTSGDTKDDSQPPDTKQNANIIKSRKKLLRPTTVPEPKIEDPLDKIVIKPFVKRKASESLNLGSEKMAKVESERTCGDVGTGSQSLRTTIDSINKHLGGADSEKESLGSPLVQKDDGKMDASSVLGKRSAEVAVTTAMTAQASVSSSSGGESPVVKKRKIKINRTSH